eukprot:4832731-Pyramimonas_sp.AAC.1
MTEGRAVIGQREDAVACLVANLATQFGPLGEESRPLITCPLASRVFATPQQDRRCAALAFPPPRRCDSEPRAM